MKWGRRHLSGTLSLRERVRVRVCGWFAFASEPSPQPSPKGRGGKRGPNLVALSVRSFENGPFIKHQTTDTLYLGQQCGQTFNSQSRSSVDASSVLRCPGCNLPKTVQGMCCFPGTRG